MKHFTLWKSFLLLCALVVGSNAWADTYTWQTASGQLSTTTTSFTVDKVTWSFSPTWADSSKKFVTYSGGQTNCYQIGSSNNKMTALEIATSGISGTITQVSVVWSSCASNSASLAVSVNGTSFTTTNGSSNSSTLQTSNYSGSASGQIKLNFTCTTGIKLQKVTVTYTSSKVATPSFSPTAGTYTGSKEVTISCGTDDATIYYTTNGSTPTTSSTEYTGAITLDATTVIKAFAVKDGMDDSEIAEATYTIKAEKPTISPSGGNFTDAQSVTLSTTTNEATIYYTTDGSTPTTSSTEYTGAFEVSAMGSTTVKAIATKSGLSNSDVTSATFNLKPKAPTFSLPEGTYGAAQSVSLSCATEGSTIYYTTDNSTPTNESSEYTSAIAVGSTMTIKAIAIKDDVSSAVASATYTINLDPYIEVNTSLNVDYLEHDGVIDVAFGHITDIMADVIICDSEGEATTYDWFDAEINSDNNVYYTIAENTSSTSRTAYLKVYALDDESNDVYSDIISITQAGINYTTLPFSWAGGTSSALTAVAGVTGSGLGNDYAASNAPYRVKFDTTGDYIQIKTNSQPGKVTVAVKMIGGAETSYITVQGSSDGEEFTDVETFTISGAQNDVHALATSKTFASTDRYIRLYFTRGSNVGVGAISIVGCVNTSMTAAGYATFCSTSPLDFTTLDNGLTAYTASLSGNTVTFNKVTTTVPAGTGLLLKGEAANYSIPVVASSTTNVSGNKLVGVTAATVIDGTSGENAYYVLQKKGENVGFYRVTNNAYIVRANSAYLEVPITAAKDFIGFDDGETTGIESIHNSWLSQAAKPSAQFTIHTDAPMYNMSGQRVSESYKGIVIVNGRKVVRK